MFISVALMVAVGFNSNYGFGIRYTQHQNTTITSLADYNFEFERIDMVTDINPTSSLETVGTLSYKDQSGIVTDLVDIKSSYEASDQMYYYSFESITSFNMMGIVGLYNISTDRVDTWTQFNYYELGFEAGFNIPYSSYPLDGYDIVFYGQFLDTVEYNNIISSSSGYEDGYNDGKSTGYQEGYQKGVTDGYAQGRADYENTSANINSIFNGILSIGLVPIEFFLSIFNFEIFGINITSIISAVLSMAVLVILLTYVLRGK